MIFAAFMMFIGWFGLSHLDTTDPEMSIIMLWILYGAVNGVAIGIGYMISVSVISLWFQERQGFASGVLIMPFIRSLKKNTQKGYMNLSITGGPTANSEFETLTQSTMAFMHEDGGAL